MSDAHSPNPDIAGDATPGPESPAHRVLLPNTSMTLDDARSRLSGLHFAKDALSDGERNILYIAEALLRHIDTQRTAD